MEVSIGEIADRYSIVKLKSERTDVDCIAELSVLKNELDSIDGVYKYVDQLYKTNGDIWDLESDIRKGKEGELGLEEVGRRAIKIRNFNGIRIEIKNIINAKYNSGFFETKIDHASAN